MYEKFLEVGKLAVVAVAFQSLVSSELVSFPKGRGLEKFIFASGAHRVVYFSGERL